MDTITRLQTERGARLRTARKLKKLNQTAVAHALGVSQSAYAEVERGERPGDAYWDRLPAMLGVSREWLMQGDKPAAVPGPSVREAQATYDEDFRTAVLKKLDEHGDMLRQLLAMVRGDGEHSELVRAALAVQVPPVRPRRVRSPVQQ